MSKAMLLMAYEAKSGKAKPSEKTEMINDIYESLVNAEGDKEWQEVRLKAPTRATVVNWLTGMTVPTNPLYLKVISRVTGIAIQDLF